MKRINRLERSYVIIALILVILIAVVGVLAVLIELKLDSISNDPNAQGMYPSIGLGKSFKADRLDYLIDAYIIEINDRYHVPQYPDRVRELIMENYTLKGDTYYYNNYLALNPFIYNPIPFYILGSFFVITANVDIFTYLSISKRLDILGEDGKFDRKDTIKYGVLSYISLNLYAAIKVLKWNK